MRNALILPVLLLLIAGCQAKPAAQSNANAPTLIASLTDQTTVWSCPECGMDFTGPGQCTMCKVDLVKMNVSYICPADDKAVTSAGKCPRCDANARVAKSAAVADAAPGGGATPDAGTTPAPAATTTPSGS